MSKALELIRTLIDGANEYEKKTGNTNPTVYLSRNNLLVIEQALLKAQEQEKELDRYKVLEKELKSEINVLFSYMEFTKLFFEIFNLNYSNETFTLSLKPNEQYNIENVDLKICLIKEDADKILKVAELLEKEVEE